jgi:hypothetical protein
VVFGGLLKGVFKIRKKKIFEEVKNLAKKKE